MKKTLIVVAIVVAATVVLFSQLNTIVETGITSKGPEVLDVSVGVEEISLSPFSGAILARGLTVGQPAGFGDGPMMALDTFSMKLKVRSLFSNHIVIEKMLVEAPLLDVRRQKGETNFQALQRGLDKQDGADEAPEVDSAKSDLTLTIRELVVRAPRIIAKTDGFLKLDEDITLADFTLTNLGTDEKGLAPEEIARHIMDGLQPQISKALIAAGASKGVKQLADDAKGKLEQGLGGLFDKLKKKKPTKENQ